MSTPPGTVQAPSDQPAAATEVVGDPAVFRAFEVREFLEWPAWDRLLRILRSNGGSYGLSGPRGAGKSWLMLRAIEWVRDAEGTGRLGGIGLWYPSPSEYDPLAFLASLSDSLGTEIDRWYRRSPRVRRRRLFEFLLILLSAGLAFAGATLLATTENLSTYAVIALALAAAIAVGIAVGLALRARPLSYAREARLASEAKLVRERARYTATRRETSEVAAEGGRGVTGRVATARERELVERPATLSSLVNDFRALAREAGDVAGRVVIAIDELDKMAEADKVPKLLRDIKGIFDVPRVHFLVSVSDEAVRSLSMGALSGRDEFNSSFYTVIEAQPATPEQIAQLLEHRSRAQVPREVALVLAILAGGNPREAIRLAELAGEATTGGEAVVKALKHEALALRRDVVTALDVEGLSPLEPKSRMGAFKALPDSCFADPASVSALANDVLEQARWHPGWADPGFEARFSEPWRRLMLRLAVGGQLVESQTIVRDRDLGIRLRDVVVTGSESAAVGRVVLEEQLRIDEPGAAVGAEAARERLLRLARDYDAVREQDPHWSDERTGRMNDITSAARAIAPDVGLSRDELTTMLASDAAGDRVVALACVAVTGDPALFGSVLGGAVKPPTWFEGYHALRALETLLPSLTPVQQTEVTETLIGAMAELDQDPPRAALAKRIVGKIEREAVKSA